MLTAPSSSSTYACRDGCMLMFATGPAADRLALLEGLDSRKKFPNCTAI